jgi:hypothetical protein
MGVYSFTGGSLKVNRGHTTMYHSERNSRVSWDGHDSDLHATNHVKQRATRTHTNISGHFTI